MNSVPANNRRGKTGILIGIIRLAVAFCLACLSVLHGQAQGSLTPPGAPAPTMKTLSQVEPRIPISSLPFTITNSGSYYLTANLTGVATANGITVQASGVTIDLRGFALIGLDGTLNGVSVPAAQTGLSIFGGVVKGWGGTGVSAANASGSQFHGLILSQNLSHGLVAGTNSVVRDCVATGNYGDGLDLTSACFAENNNCQANRLVGVHVLGNACRVEANHVGGNGSAGLQVDGSQNLIVKNSAINNGGNNYSVATNNDYGQILANPGAGFTNVNPWANFVSASTQPCADGTKDGNETDIDCGGGLCSPCAVGKQCHVGQDCTSGVCTAGVCVAGPTCSDGIKNGNETDIDCGGGTCSPCAAGRQCYVGTDCTSGICTAGVCVAGPTCSDGIKNGTETDIDCGGGTCSPCAVGKHCSMASDCATGAYCSPTGVCTSLLANGSSCSSASQCSSAHCVDGFCCNTVCSGGCQACSYALSGSPNGTCGLAKTGTNPRSACPGTETCNGVGICQ